MMKLEIEAYEGELKELREAVWTALKALHVYREYDADGVAEQAYLKLNELFERESKNGRC